MTGIKHVLGAAALLMIILPAVAQTGEGQTVVDIKVRGNAYISTSTILSHVKTRPGETFYEQIVKADERRLMETGRFQSVVATKAETDEGLIVTFTIQEWPTILDLAFAGNKAFSDGELLKELSYGVGDPLNRLNVELGRQAIRNKYLAKGYFSAEVTVDADALDKNHILYRIVEGPQASVRKIRFDGNDFHSTFKLKWKVGQNKRLWPFVSGYVNMEQIERDVVTIRNLYIQEGFLDAEVGRRLDFSPDRRKVELTYLINEGPRYRINEISFTGNELFRDIELLRRMKFSRGDFYTVETLRYDLQRLEDTYGELGFINAGVASKIRYVDPTAELPEWAKDLPDDVALLNLHFNIDQDRQYRIGRIDIRGNTITQQRVIRRELGFFPGQLFNNVAVKESQRQLRDTWLFEEVNISPAGGSEDSRDVLVQVKEGKTAEFMIGAGVSTNTGLLGTVSFAQRNFNILAWPSSWDDVKEGRAWRGAAQTFRVVVEPGTELSRLNVEWFNPYVFDRQYSVGTEAFLFTRQRETYDENRYGGQVSLGHRYKNNWYAEIAAQAEGIEIDDIDSIDAPPEVAALKGQHGMYTPRLTLVRDRTDSRWIPTKGDRLRLSHEQALGDFSFGRSNVDYRIYHPVLVDAMDRKHVLAGRVIGGYIFGSAPFFEKFYGGGLGSIRGFRYRGVSPRSRFAGFTHEPVGGDFVFFAGAEYNVPLVGDNFRGVFFLDSGTVERNLEITTYRVSTGFGLRWIIPAMGPVPLSLDFGFPIRKDDSDDTQLISFSIGWTF